MSQEQKQSEEKTVQVQIVPDPTIRPLFSDTVHTNFTEEVLQLTFCTKEFATVNEQPVMYVTPHMTVIMTPGKVAALIEALTGSLDRWKKAYLKQELPEEKSGDQN